MTKQQTQSNEKEFVDRGFVYCLLVGAYLFGSTRLNGIRFALFYLMLIQLAFLTFLIMLNYTLKKREKETTTIK